MGGAKNCPETPRQKLIGMMYLFLTAMLAINVSKEIINSFIAVNTSLENTNKVFFQKNAHTYLAIDNAKANDPVRAAPYFEAAMQAKKWSEELDKYIAQIKIDIVEKTEGCSKEEAIAKSKDLWLIGMKDNYDVSTHHMVGDGTKPSVGEARKLKNKLIEYKKNLIGLFDKPGVSLHNKGDEIKKMGELGIITDDNKNVPMDKPEEKHWETAKFYHLPIVACITMLSELQNEVKNAEATIINKLLGSIGATAFKFDTLAAKVIPKSNYVIQGDRYEADLFVAAFSTTSDPKIFIGSGYDSVNGKLLPPIDSIPVTKGVGKYIMPASSTGARKFAALIEVKNQTTGEVQTYPLKVGKDYYAEYMVAKPSAVISPTKMNVLYIGVDNPLDISVAGFPDDKVTASITQGSLRKLSGGSYIARVNTVGKLKINVSVKDDRGTSRSMGGSEFRVKRVPDPVPKVAGSKGGDIKKGLFAAQTGVKAELENFDFDLTFTVTEFLLSANIGGFSVTKPARGPLFTAEQKQLIEKMKRFEKVYIEDVRCKGPDGTIRKIGTIAFKID